MNVEDFSLNIELFYLINHTRHPLLDEFFRYFYVLGKGYILIPIVIYLAFLKREKLKPFILALVLESALVHILKFAFKAPRSASMLKDVYLLEPLYHKSFPSGDTAMAFLLACFFSQGASTPIKILLFVYAFLIAYGRMYLGVHFPMDVLVGAIIGVLSCKFFIRRQMFKFFHKKEQSP